MKDLNNVQQITRRTMQPWNYQGRRLLVSLGPGDTITFREERRRESFTANLSTIFTFVVKMEAAKQKREKAADRIARRSSHADS
jgi:hypothetical protein